MTRRNARRQRLVDWAKNLFADGYTVREVAMEMNLPESTVRSLERSIDEAEKKNKR